MKLLAFLVADASSQGDGKTSILGAGVTRISPPSLPWHLPQLAVVAMFELDEGDDDREHTFHLDLLGPDGGSLTPTMTARFDPRTMPPNQHVDGERRELHWTAVLVPLPLVAPGVYRFVLTVEGGVTDDRSFVVIDPSS